MFRKYFEDDWFIDYFIKIKAEMEKTKKTCLSSRYYRSRFPHVSFRISAVYKTAMRSLKRRLFSSFNQKKWTLWDASRYYSCSSKAWITARTSLLSRVAVMHVVTLTSQVSYLLLFKKKYFESQIQYWTLTPSVIVISRRLRYRKKQQRRLKLLPLKTWVN